MRADFGNRQDEQFETTPDKGLSYYGCFWSWTWQIENSHMERRYQ